MNLVGSHYGLDLSPEHFDPLGEAFRLGFTETPVKERERALLKKDFKTRKPLQWLFLVLRQRFSLKSATP